MAAAGAGGSTKIGVPDAVAQAFKDLKQKRKLSWMTFRLNPDTFELEVAKTGARGSGVADFVKALPDSEARFAVYDQAVQNTYGGSGSKLFCFLWAPPTGGRSNVLYSSQRRGLDGLFTGVEDKQVTTRRAVEDVLAAAGGVKKVDDDDGEFDPDA